jgi:hypothetical protein
VVRARGQGVWPTAARHSAARAGAARAGRARYGSGHAFCPLPFTPPPPLAGHSGEALGDLPDPASLPPLPTFTPAGGPSSSGLDVLAAAAADNLPQSGDPPSNAHGSLHIQGPYNPAASLPPKVVKKILALEFVEMSELRGDSSRGRAQLRGGQLGGIRQAVPPSHVSQEGP